MGTKMILINNGAYSFFAPLLESNNVQVNESMQLYLRIAKKVYEPTR